MDATPSHRGVRPQPPAAHLLRGRPARVRCHPSASDREVEGSSCAWRVRWGPCHVVSIHCGRETLLRYHAGHTRATPAACNRGPFSYVTACQPLRRLARPGPSLSGSDRGARSWKWAASISLIPSSQMRNSWGTTFLSEPDADTLHNRMWGHCSPTAVTENATSVVATAAGPGSVRALSTESDGPPPPAGSSPEEHLHPGPHSTVMPV